MEDKLKHNQAISSRKFGAEDSSPGSTDVAVTQGGQRGATPNDVDVHHNEKPSTWLWILTMIAAIVRFLPFSSPTPTHWSLRLATLT